jgi:RNA binding exosome subunit|tara:strand:- start:1505 stop:1957 length:453 start_codon:yes stop_codon:yes gene_type:complete
MKLAHLIRVRVYIKDGDNEENVLNSFLSFFPFDLEKEKLAIETRSAEGLEHKKIRILELTLTKEKHTSQFLDSLTTRLDNKQKELILNQADSRLDNDLKFFLRFNKDKLVNENQLELTDSGNCLHIKISIATFPAKREKAMEVIKKIFLL